FVFFYSFSYHPEAPSLSLHDALPISDDFRFLGEGGAARRHDDIGHADLLGDLARHRIDDDLAETACLDDLGNRRGEDEAVDQLPDRKSTRLNSSHVSISYAVFCLKKK